MTLPATEGLARAHAEARTEESHSRLPCSQLLTPRRQPFAAARRHAFASSTRSSSGAAASSASLEYSVSAGLRGAVAQGAGAGSGRVGGGAEPAACAAVAPSSLAGCGSATLLTGLENASGREHVQLLTRRRLVAVLELSALLAAAARGVRTHSASSSWRWSSSRLTYSVP